MKCLDCCREFLYGPDFTIDAARLENCDDAVTVYSGRAICITHLVKRLAEEKI